MFQRILSQPIDRILILGMVVIALIPISLIAIHLHKTAWSNSWREIHEKHQLLAENLASPIQMYVNDHFDNLNLLAESIKPVLSQPKNLQSMLNMVVIKLSGIGALAYVDVTGNMLAYKVADDISIDQKSVSTRVFNNERSYLFIRQTEKEYVSGIKPSPFNSKPTIIMGVPVFNQQEKLIGVLLAELRISVIEQLRKSIKFGKAGHSAIVDQNGRVIAHPNSEWMVEMKDLSSWPIVQAMKAGKHGVVEFYSSFTKLDMVAGYTAIPGTGWGIMVPQPKSEVEAQVNQFMFSNYTWGGIGLLAAIIIGIFMSNWIIRPINRLAKASQGLLDNNLKGEIEYPADSEPREVKQLGYALKSLVRGLQYTRKEVDELNTNLQNKVDDATRQLRYTNEKLEDTVRSDFLTSLVNRRYFEMDLSDVLSRRQHASEHISLLLFDIDNFKYFNDTYGHAAGDEVLLQVARTLEHFMRPGDIVARYAGDEFVVRLRCDRRVAMSRANDIREAIQGLNVVFRNSVLHVTVSIGVFSEVMTSEMDVKNVLRNVDLAMYEAKKHGRNCVETFNHSMTKVCHAM